MSHKIDLFRADNLEAAREIAGIESKRLGKKLQVYHVRGTRTWWICTLRDWETSGLPFDPELSLPMRKGNR